MNALTSRRGLLEAYAKDHGVYVATYSPGDCVTRYRFTTTDTGYFAARSSEILFTALGLKEAEAWLSAYIQGYMAGLREARD